MNKVLLVGGAGFIGSRFSQLTKHDYEIADRLTTGDIVRTSPRMNLPRANFDSVIFLAAEPNLAAAVANPERAYKTMTQGLHNCLERYKDSHFVYASSSMAYGDWTSDAMSEQDVCSPTNIYGQLKLLGEGIVKQFHNNWTIVRPSAVYGPFDKPNRVVNLFINKIQNNEQITLQGADNLFDFTYVDDIVHGLERVVDLKPQGETYNITRGHAHTLQSMTDMLYAKLNKEPNYIAEPKPANYPRRGALDITKANEELEYVPQFDLNRGLDDTIHRLAESVSGVQN
jgi:nucleoside-diphosphate-sugar epimerase